MLVSFRSAVQHLPRHEDPVKLVYAWGEKRLQELEQQGIARERIIFDPGIGFGKHAEQSLALIKNAADFSSLDVRILFGHSRKSLLALFTHYTTSARDTETMAITLYLDKQRVDYLRVHNVEISARGLRVSNAFRP